jgi:hypothetical protein
VEASRIAKWQRDLSGFRSVMKALKASQLLNKIPEPPGLVAQWFDNGEPPGTLSRCA